MEFILFFSPRKKEVKETPTHIAAHFQAHTSLHSAQRLVKELQSSHHSTNTMIHSLHYLKKKNKKNLD